MVPVVVWAIAQRQMQIAFLLFLAAGVSDAVDGFLAKRFGMASELGAHLDPLADKALIVDVVKASLADIKEGSYIGSGAVPQADGWPVSENGELPGVEIFPVSRWML